MNNLYRNNLDNVSTVELQAKRDRLIAGIEVINQELAKRGVLTEENYELLSNNPNSMLSNLVSHSASGWLDPFTVSKKNVDCPQVNGERDRNNPKHWYWSYRWRDEKGRRQAKYVAQKKVAAVRTAISAGKSPEQILNLISRSKCSQKETTPQKQSQVVVQHENTSSDFGKHPSQSCNNQASQNSPQKAVIRKPRLSKPGNG